MLNSAYPGARAETGGGGMATLFRYIGNPLFPFSCDGVPGNTCESAAFYDLFPFGLITSLALLRKRKDTFTIAILIAGLFLGIYIIIGFPTILSTVSLMSKVTVGRCAVALSYINMLLLFRSAALLSNNRGQYLAGLSRTSIILIIASVPITAVCAYKILYTDYFKSITGMVCIIILLIAVLGFLLQEKAFCVVVCVICLLSGFTVNPFRSGVDDVLYQNNFGNAIRETVNDDADAVWMGISDFFGVGDYTVMFGARTLNSTNTYIHHSLWEKLDPEGVHYELYNRYAHISTILKSEGNADIELLNADYVRITITADQLASLGVKYIATDQEAINYQTENTGFDPVYISESSDWSIYRVVKKY